MRRLKGVVVWVLGVMLAVSGVPFFVYAQSAYQVEDDAPLVQDVDRGVVSLDFKDANLKDVLKVFSQQSGLNFVASKEIEGRNITLYMNNVSVEDALRTLLDANNLQLAQSPGSNILIVKAKPTPPIETRTRVYKIRYYHGNSIPGQYSMAGQGKGGGQEKTLQIDTIIRPLLSEFGTVISYMNLLIITDVPDRFQLIDQVISEIDRPIAEVMLEVEVIETTADFLKDLGVKWSGEMARYSGPSRVTDVPFGRFADIPQGVAAADLELDGATAFSYGMISSQALTWMLRMLTTDTNTKFLAKPRVLCQDREWAEMRITANQIVSLKTTVTSGSGSTTLETEVERMEVGTVLRMVPIINEEERLVSLLLEPSVSRAIDSRFTAPDGTSFVDPQYRTLRTVVMIRSGETVAVGGFITTEDTEIQTKVPYLGDIPLLGALFRHKSTARVDKELLIFITPRIMSSTQKVDLWGTAPEPEPEQIFSLAPPAEKAVSVPADADAGAPSAAVPTPQGLAFREQEDLNDLRINMTLKGAGAGVIDLAR